MTNHHLTEEQLSNLKNRLLTDVEKIRGTIKALKEQDPFNDPSHVLDNAAIDTDVREQLGHETVEAEVKALQRKLKKVESALRRMQNGTYGIDARTKEPIPFERLDVVPEAEHTVSQEKKLVK